LNWLTIKRIIVGLASTAAMLSFGSVSPAQSTSLEAATPASSLSQPDLHMMKKLAAAVDKPKPIPYIKLGTKGQNATWINEALATLNYLPVEFNPASNLTNPSLKPESVKSTTSTATTDTTTASNASAPQKNDDTVKTKPEPDPVYITLSNQLKAGKLQPLPGKWIWNGQYPKSLIKLWDPNAVTTMTQGAIMRFESDQGLSPDGIAGPLVDKALIVALSKNQQSTDPYVYVTVSKSGAQHLDVWQDGKKKISIPANTGIHQSPTPNGTWPIYARMKSQTMKGNLPGGGTYSDPGVPWVNYFYKGCAIHGFVRSSYGSAQSLGCVELPVNSAKKLFTMLDYGTLVTVNA
jgi:lipoprotein-anchoring transpeptidase ErfK/SrfK